MRMSISDLVIDYPNVLYGPSFFRWLRTMCPILQHPCAYTFRNFYPFVQSTDCVMHFRNFYNAHQSTDCHAFYRKCTLDCLIIPTFPVSQSYSPLWNTSHSWCAPVEHEKSFATTSHTGSQGRPDEFQIQTSRCTEVGVYWILDISILFELRAPMFIMQPVWDSGISHCRGSSWPETMHFWASEFNQFL